MAESQDSGQERTESPTPRRREEARQQGQIARSPELVAALILLGGGLLLAAWGGEALAQFARRSLIESSRSLSGGAITSVGAVAMLRATFTGLMLALLPFTLGVAGLAIGGNVLQTRGSLAWSRIEPKWSNLDVVAGFKRIFGVDSLFTLVKSGVKLVGLTLVTALVLSRAWPQIMALGDTGTLGTALVLRDLLVRLVVVCGLAFLAIAGADYAWQWFRLQQRLKMTRQEVLREFRESEGNPMVKARQFSLARARARQRMMQRVPHADVVVVNPTHIAVALRYDISVAPAPIVVALGERKIAERIKALALKSGVPIIENKPVARALLATSKLGQPIAPALYAAIAEILAFVYRTRAPHRLAAIAAGEQRPG